VRSSLLWKLIGINILTIGFVILIVWMSVDYLAADYFVALMKQYNISPVAGHRMFLDSVHRYLIWATLAAIALALTLSFLMTRRVLEPLRQMADITRKIASGDYAGRAPVKDQDEVGKLGAAFNRMAESLQAIEILRKDLMIDVAHELRTPLTNIQGYLEALLDGVTPPSRENFELLHEETLRLVDLVESVLRLARADAARANLRKTEIIMGDLIKQVLEAFLSQFEAKGIGVELDFHDSVTPAQGDGDKLSQVARNLIQNALQYTEPGGSLKISTIAGPGDLKVVFANSGGELSERDIPLIFERFYRGEKSRSREHGGAGIGLAIVKQLIEAHNGAVGAEIAPGETRVWFSLPVQ
jgi:two-component system, OmpR family, sensor histidine kinase BaeS